MEPGQHGDKSSAFPSFLGEDPFPSTSNDGRPTTSSSNATSEFEASRRPNDITGLSGPVGEPGLPPARPVSGTFSEESSQAGWQRGSARGSYTAPPSRRGFPFRGDGGSRPTSAVGQTHVPSLMAQGFFRPMSPQILQAQRGQGHTPNAGSRLQSPVPAETLTEEQEQERDQRFQENLSSATLGTDRDGRLSPTNGSASPELVSRGFSDATSSGDGYGVQSTVGAGSVMSKASTAPLAARPSQPQQKLGTVNGSPPPKSTRSLRASLGLGSKHSSLRNVHDRKISRSHEKLHSTPQTPVGATNEKAVPLSPAARSTRTSGKNYEYFAGNMLFFCSGRLMNTKATPLNVATFVLTALPAALFFGFSAPWLWHNISPALPIIFAYIFFLSISAFFHAAFSDPGILPRNLHPHPPNPDEDRDPLTVGPATTEWIMVKTFPSQKQKIDPQAGAENGQAQAGPTTAMEVPTKYCKSCGIWRPPRAHHCRVCDACMETQDHHCVWLNNCVGRRNYRFFFAYVGFSSILAILLLAFSAVHISYFAKVAGITFGSALSGRTQERVAFGMLIYSILALPYPGSLFVYHLFLVSRGETTREYLNSHKFLPKDRHRPFSQSNFLTNWCAVLMRPRPPSYMSFKRPHTKGDSRYGHTVRRKERLQNAKQEAARSDSRVHGLKNRFSVPRPGTNTSEARQNDSAMEMKQLPASSKKDANDLTGGGLKAPGNMNSTPR